MSTRVTARELVAAFGGLVVWAVHFGAVYAINAVKCARSPAVGSDGAVVTAIVVATLVAVAAVVALWRLGVGAERGDPAAQSTRWMLGYLARWLNGLSIIAILLTAVPVFVVAPCG